MPLTRARVVLWLAGADGDEFASVMAEVAAVRQAREKAVPRTFEQRRAHERAYDQQVADGWERNGKPPTEPQMPGKTYPPSIVGTRRARQ